MALMNCVRRGRFSARPANTSRLGRQAWADASNALSRPNSQCVRYIKRPVRMSPQVETSIRRLCTYQMSTEQTAATPVASGEIMNIMPAQPKNPSAENTQLTRNEGRQLGLPINSSSMDDRFNSAYADRLKMVSTGAMALMSPSQMATAAKRMAHKVAMRGSFFFPKPRPISLGTAPSLANACSVRGADRSEPSAEESVAAQTPAMIVQPQRAHFIMTSESVKSRSRLSPTK